MNDTARPLARDGVLTAPPIPRLAEVALFADLDGTLAPLEATPDAVGPDKARRRLLDALRLALGGRLAVVSGRSLPDLDRVLEGRIPALGAVHGLIRRNAENQIVRSGGSGRMGEAVRAFRDFAKTERNLLVEDKEVAAALHYRGEPAAGAACRDLARRLGVTLGLSVQEGDMVVELRRPGPNKGDAVRAFMAEAPFTGFTPLFLGDDLTDEDGFKAARDLGGHGIIVGPRRPTSARYALESVAAARAWLDQSLGAAK
jgi:trehalose 6-phosphate phosphatase